MPRTATAPVAERPRTPGVIAAEIDDAQAARRDAEAELGRLAAARPALLLDTSRGADAALDAHDTAAAKARRTLERADAQLGRLGPELEEARAAERLAAARAAYAKGEAAAAEYRRLVIEVYGPAAQAIAAALHRMAAALDAVREANRQRPDDAPEIDADEFRHPPYEPEPRPPATVEAEVWVDSMGTVLRSVAQGNDADGVVMHLGAQRARRSIPNPALATWSPTVRQFAPKILGRVGLPGADDTFWLVRPL